MKIPSTRNDQETVNWQQWHQWNRLNPLVTVKLQKGVHVLMLKTVSNGDINYDFLEFKLIK